MSAELRHRDAVVLAHALCGYLAQEEGLRALSIKGFTLEMDHLRSERTPADADILVDPLNFDQLLALLEERGWHPRAQRATARIIPDHSITLIHDSWSCDIDLHWYFPGLFSNPAEAFEALWNDRRYVQVAGTSVLVPSRQGCALLGLLHVLRYPQSTRHQLQKDEILHGIANWSEEDLSCFERLAIRTRAAEVLNEELSWGIPLPGGTRGAQQARELVRWKLYTRTHEDGSTSAWFFSIMQADWRARPRLLWRAIYPSADDLRFEFGETISLYDRIKLRLRRAQRGLRALPKAVREAIKQRS